jgi:nicotinate-nucleotide--dimethylbenzimidazole phosphoribosyltransferase
MTLFPPPIPEFGHAAAAAARAHQVTLTKPPGSLGRLEELAVWYAGARGTFPVAVPERAEVFVFAADHGVAAEGVSAYPASVTAAMVANFRAGGAAVNVLAHQCRLWVTVVDVGVATDLSASSGTTPAAGTRPAAPVAAGPSGARFVAARVRAGTANLRREPAMSRMQAEEALNVGLSIARESARRDIEILAGGDMGIANTTAAAALICALSGDDPALIVGRGTGIDDATLARKAGVVREALSLHRPNPNDVLGTLAAVGGLEIAALAGLMIGGAAGRIPVVVDGFVAGAAALVAIRLCPRARQFLLLSHRSAERGAERLCALLGAPAPLFDLDLRLGEGTGAALAVQLLRAAVATQGQMATFASAGIPHEH